MMARVAKKRQTLTRSSRRSRFLVSAMGLHHDWVRQSFRVGGKYCKGRRPIQGLVPRPGVPR